MCQPAALQGRHRPVANRAAAAGAWYAGGGSVELPTSIVLRRTPGRAHAGRGSFFVRGPATTERAAARFLPELTARGERRHRRPPPTSVRTGGPACTSMNT